MKTKKTYSAALAWKNGSNASSATNCPSKLLSIVIDVCGAPKLLFEPGESPDEESLAKKFTRKSSWP